MTDFRGKTCGDCAWFEYQHSRAGSCRCPDVYHVTDCFPESTPSCPAFVPRDAPVESDLAKHLRELQEAQEATRKHSIHFGPADDEPNGMPPMHVPGSPFQSSPISVEDADKAGLFNLLGPSVPKTLVGTMPTEWPKYTCPRCAWKPGDDPRLPEKPKTCEGCDPVTISTCRHDYLLAVARAVGAKV